MSEPLAQPRPQAGRVRCIDWLRGLVVFDMIMWHSACLLTKDRQAQPLYADLGNLAGLVAPSFMFAAGFAIALLMVRASGDPAARRRRALKSLRRITEVLIVALFLKFMLRRDEPYWWLKIDILSTIAYSLLLAWPLMVAIARWPAVAAIVSLVLAMVCFGLSPMLPDEKWGILIRPNSSDFSLTPWAGYVFLGTAVGSLASRGTMTLALSLAGVVVVGVFFRALKPVWEMSYGGNNPYVLWNAGERLIKMGLIAVTFLGIETLAAVKEWRLKWPPFSWLETVGTNALTAYAVHIWLLFVSFPVDLYFSRFWYQKATWTQYWILLVVLWAMVIFVCWAWPRLKEMAARRLPWNRPKTVAA